MATRDPAQSGLSEMLIATDATLSRSLVEILTVAIQELIEAELTARIGAEPGECTPMRVTQRNGHRPKLVSTPAGDIEVGSPNSAQGRSSPTCWSPAGGSTRRCGR